jgi:uncharacterized protein
MARETIGSVLIDGREQPIELDPDAGRIDVRAGEHVSFIKIRLRDSTLALIHTEVSPALRGKGIADGLARAALDYARGRGWTVKPYCPFVAKFIERHAEYAALVDPEFAPGPPEH